MPLEFPSPAAVDAEYKVNDVTYTYDGEKWTAKASGQGGGGGTAGGNGVGVDDDGNVIILGDLFVAGDVEQDPNATPGPATTDVLTFDADGNVTITGNLKVKGVIDDN